MTWRRDWRFLPVEFARAAPTSIFRLGARLLRPSSLLFAPLRMPTQKKTQPTPEGKLVNSDVVRGKRCLYVVVVFVVGITLTRRHILVDGHKKVLGAPGRPKRTFLIKNNRLGKHDAPPPIARETYDIPRYQV